MHDWQQFKSEFKDTFRVDPTKNRVYLNTYAPSRKPGEGVGQYADRIYSYLDNFHEDGEMLEMEKLDNLKRILYLQLPRDIIMSIQLRI